MSGRYLLCLTILLFTTFCIADHHLTCSPISVCAGDMIRCNCTFDSDTDYVVWSVRDGAGMEVGTTGWLNSNNSFYTSRISMGNFTFYYFDDISMASIRVSPQNNNYRIVCSLPDENSTDLVDAVYPSAFDVRNVQPLENFTLDFQDPSRTQVTANWTDYDNDCLSGYNVNITRDNGPPMTYFTQDSEYILTNASSSVLYTFRVMPAGFVSSRLRNDLASDPESIILDVPVSVTNVRVNYMPIAMDAQDGTQINVTVRWNAMRQDRPRTNYYYITHNATRHLENMESGMGSGSGRMSDDETSPSVFVTRRRMARRMSNFQRLLGAVVGETYTVSIVAENAIGNSTATSLTFTLTYMPPQPSSTSVMMTATPTSTATPSSSPTVDDDDDESLPTWAIAVIAVGGGIFLAVIIAVLILVICCCCCAAAAAAKTKEEHEMTVGTEL